MAFNLYLSRTVGTAGVGRFSLVMSVYGFAVTAASAGIGLAVTRVIAEADNGDPGLDACRIHAAKKTGYRYSLLTGSLAALLLFCLAPQIAARCLHDAESTQPLRILALSLPPLAVSAVANGYFVARRRAAFGAVCSVLALFLRIVTTVFFLRFPVGSQSSAACLAMTLGCLISELGGCLAALLLTRFCRTPAQIPTSACPMLPPPTRAIVRIAFPIAVTACIRSGLGTLLHLLIPVGLERAGLSTSDALSAYGTVHGIVLPLILFPAAFLQSASSLLIPEIAHSHTAADHAAVRRWENRVLRLTLWYACFVSGMFTFHAEDIARLLGGDPLVSAYLRMLAPLIPVMNLDTMVDAFLKGLDEQVASMRYNILDAAFSVCMAYLLLPKMGVFGYIVLLYASESFNLLLSITKLHKVSPLKPQLLLWVFLPLFSVVGANAITSLFMEYAAGIGIVFRFPLSALITRITASALLYTAFLRFYAQYRENLPKTPSFFGRTVVKYK